MTSQPEQLRERTSPFAVRIVKLFQALPKTAEARVLGNQVLRSGTSVAANYRAACRARSKEEFVAKVGVIVEEADETTFWLELLVETGVVQRVKMESLLKEANELLRIFVASRQTATAN